MDLLFLFLQLYTDKNKNYKDTQNGKGVKDRLLVDSRVSNM